MTVIPITCHEDLTPRQPQHPMIHYNGPTLASLHLTEAAMSSEYQISKRFDSPTSDLTLLSSDNVIFRVHRKNLEMHSQVFADAGRVSDSVPLSPPPSPRSSSSSSPAEFGENDFIRMSETSELLSLMLQYMYLQPQPALNCLPFEVMAGLAEAVEKYQIYAAMGVCETRMRELIKDDPIGVLLYAARHRRGEMVEEAAREALRSQVNLSDVIERANWLAVPWIAYYQSHCTFLAHEFARFGPSRSHPSSNSSASSPCQAWFEAYALVVSTLTHPGAVYTLPSVLEHHKVVLEAAGKCEMCRKEIGYWMERCNRDLGKLQAFETYM